MSFVWSHDDKEDTEYWKGLTTLHGLIKYSVYGEIIISCGIICLLFVDYKQTYGNNLNPLNLNYARQYYPLMHQIIHIFFLEKIPKYD